MLFSSITFLYYFLPVVLIIYFAVPNKAKNLVLMIASFIFYGWGEPIYLVFMLLSIIVHYVLALLIERHRSGKLAKLWLILGLLFSLALLAYFKYADFFIENFNKISGLSIHLLNVGLPLGISFYTFQIISYSIDVYRGDAKAQKNIVSLATYLSMFPQLIAGPIVRYVDVASELETRRVDPEQIRSGISRFVMGLAKKVVLADSLGQLCKYFLEIPEQTVLFFWLYAISFTLQIYLDFSAYSDMAIGLGRILGFDFPENFNYPFIAKSITEFWRRWHISLSSWFRDYLYIPIGGSRVGKFHLIINLLIVWMLTGLWHGAAWNFVIWGLFFAVLLIGEKLLWGKLLDKTPGWFQHIYVLFLVVISFVIFDASDMTIAFSRIISIFGGNKLPLADSLSFYYLRSYALTIILAIIVSTPLLKNIYLRLQANEKFQKLFLLLEPLRNAVLLLLVTAYLVDSTFSPFLYFRF